MASSSCIGDVGFEHLLHSVRLISFNLDDFVQHLDCGFERFVLQLDHRAINLAALTFETQKLRISFDD